MKYFACFLVAAFVWITYADAQPFSKGRRVISFTDPARNARQVNTEVYYPANIPGNDVPVATGTGKFPVVVFGHGFVIPVSSYSWLADSLVKNGFIVAMPTTEGSLSPSHDNFGKDLAFLCSAIPLLDADPSSFLYQRVIPKTAVAGHSMGGGCSFLAAAANPAIDAVFNFAAAETNPSATAAASQVNKPALVYSGSGDCIVAPAVQQSMYNNLTGSCKTYINVNNALHCQFANNNGTCAFGQFTTGCNSSSITAAITFDKVSYLLLPFLDYYLKGICIRGEDFQVAYSTITGVSKASNCSNFPSCGVLPVNLLDFYGTAAGKTVSLIWNVATESNLLHYTVEKSSDGSNFKACMQETPQGSNTSYKAIDLYPYPSISYYRLKTTDKDGSFTYSGIVKVRTKESALAITGFFPNPVNDILNIEMFVSKKQMVTFRILNSQGQKLLNGSRNLSPGIFNDKLILNKLAKGSYFLTFNDQDGQLINTIQFFKK